MRRRPLRQELGRHYTRRVGARRQWRSLRHRGCRALHVVLLGRCTAPRAAASAPAPAAAATSTTAATAATAFAAAAIAAAAATAAAAAAAVTAEVEVEVEGSAASGSPWLGRCAQRYLLVGGRGRVRA